LAELKFRLQAAHTIAKHRIGASKNRQKSYYDKRAKEVTFNVGDLVLLKKAFKDNKLSALYKGPYKIIAVTSPVNSVIVVGRKNYDGSQQPPNPF
jgi:hypothetical protein